MTCRDGGDRGDSVGTIEGTGSLELPLLLVLQGLCSSTLSCLGRNNMAIEVMLEMRTMLGIGKRLVFSCSVVQEE